MTSTSAPTRYDVSRVPLQGAYIAKHCPVRAQNDILQPCEPAPVSASLERRFERGRRFEAEIFDRLRSTHSDAAFINAETAAACELATSEALTTTRALIIGGRLPSDEHGRRVGKPDVLVPAAGGGWRPVDVKHHLTLSARDPQRPGLDAPCSALEAPGLEDAAVEASMARRKHRDDMLQLAHYQRMLEAAGFAATDGRYGGIVGTEGVVTWHDLDEPVWRTPSSTGKTKLRSTMQVYDFEFAFRLDIMAVARRHLEGETAQLLVVPVMVPECGTCPWVVHCTEQLGRGAGDVSLLPKVGWRDWSAHRQRGVHDRQALADLDFPTAQIVSAGVDPARLIVDDRTASYFRSGVKALPEQIDLARAALGGDPVYRRRGVHTVEVPRADVEVDVDMENVEDGCYLWGTWTTDRSGRCLGVEGYRPFVTWEPLGGDAELDNFRRFWAWLTGLRREVEAAGFTFRAYCYSQAAENRYLRSQGEATGVLGEVDAFIDSDAWVDLLPIFRDQLITGHGNGLKETAPLAGFEWSVDDPSGEDSMVSYDLAAGADEDAREWLLSYNQGDVRATLALREWLASAASHVPSIG